MNSPETFTHAAPPVQQHADAAASRVSDSGIVRGAIGLTLISLLGFGFLYSLAGVGVGQLFFPATANGSLLYKDNQIVGSALVAQPFDSDLFFHARPSAGNYDTMALAGSNQARTNPQLRQRIAEARAAVAQRESVPPSAIPGDLITQSGSGIDPHISPASAILQIDRIAKARGLTREQVKALVSAYTEPRQFGFLGRPRVNVLALNLALDTLRGQP